MRCVFRVTLVAVIGLQNILSSPDDIWEELPPMPEGRSGMVAFVTGNSEPAYYGGTSWDERGKHIMATGYALSDGQWRPLDTLHNPIAYSATASEAGRLYAAGGSNGIEARSTILVWEADRPKTLIELAPSRSRIYAGAALVEGVLYQIGGSTSVSPLSPSADVSKFEQGVWSDVGQLPEGSLINPAVCSWKGQIIVIGGGIAGAEGLRNTDAIFSFQPDERRWNRLARLSSPSRGAVALAIPNYGILIIGGYLDKSVFSSKAQLFNPDKNRFVSLANLPVGLMLPAVVKTEKWLYVFGGEDAARHRSSQTYRAALSRLLPNHAE